MGWRELCGVGWVQKWWWVGVAAVAWVGGRRLRAGGAGAGGEGWGELLSVVAVCGDVAEVPLLTKFS